MILIRHIVLAFAIVGASGCAHSSHSRESASELFQRKADRTVLEAIPQMRHEALVRCAERVEGDTTPEYFEKQRQYIEALRQSLRKLYDAYYWSDGYPKDLNAATDEHAIRLAMLEQPSRHGLRGCSGYEAAIIRHTVQLHEQMIVTAARGICDYLNEDGVAISYDAWKSSWNDAANVEKLNKADAPNRSPAAGSR